MTDNKSLEITSQKRRRFYFLRHGETDWNKIGRVQGQVDVPLNSLGLHQAISSVKIIQKLSIKTIYSSPLLRAQQTAKIICDAIGCELQTIENLKECNWGVKQGCALGTWMDDWKNGSYTPSGGESFILLRKRVKAVLDLVVNRPGPVLFISHTGVNWAIEDAVKGGKSQPIPNCIPVLLKNIGQL